MTRTSASTSFVVRATRSPVHPLDDRPAEQPRTERRTPRAGRRRSSREDERGPPRRQVIRVWTTTATRRGSSGHPRVSSWTTSRPSTRARRCRHGNIGHGRGTEPMSAIGRCTVRCSVVRRGHVGVLPSGDGRAVCRTVSEQPVVASLGDLTPPSGKTTWSAWSSRSGLAVMRTVVPPGRRASRAAVRASVWASTALVSSTSTACRHRRAMPSQANRWRWPPRTTGHAPRRCCRARPGARRHVLGAADPVANGVRVAVPARPGRARGAAGR